MNVDIELARYDLWLGQFRILLLERDGTPADPIFTLWVEAKALAYDAAVAAAHTPAAAPAWLAAPQGGA